MNQRLILSLDENANFSYLKCSKFKSDLISFNMFLPLEREKVSRFAVLPGILAHECAMYPTFVEFNKKIEELYGANISTDISKIGDYQLLSIYASSINKKFTIEKSDIMSELSDLLIELVFNPNIDSVNGFNDLTVAIEKHENIENIKAELNDKRCYSLAQCDRLIFGNQKGSINKYGDIDEINKITPKIMLETYKEVISTAHIEIMMISDIAYDEIYEKFKNKISKIDRKPKIIFKNELKKHENCKIKRKNEVMDVSQSKLVIGCTTEVAAPSDEMFAMSLVSYILGGTLNSKLFLNVREKLSLCYYCSSHYTKSIGMFYIESGVEFKNLEQAEIEILNQLESIKSGDITDEELSNVLKYITQIFKSTEDSLSGIESWYIYQIVSGLAYTPDEFSNRISKVTKEEIVKTSQKVKVNCVYILSNQPV
ncbi:MAG: predicted Zn-dependent peptidases [Candidatus Improbicoccus devescovinae]|nr:MAG: predicted Zn-dependent peptidases [Candidatus Improbicoccus devescovinae]